MIDLIAINKLVAQKYISVNKHPDADLYIYNYSQNTQYEGLWNEITLNCRGLILNKKGEILARPFPKFFNFEELNSRQIPKENFEVYEKMDGSLGILYWLNNNPYIATRGSFTSDQAKWASLFLHQKYSSVFELLDKTKTYLFEIIYPENRIVVDYKNESDLILLAVLDTITGLDLELPTNLGFKLVKKHDGIRDISELSNYEADNFEGFVVKFSSGYRLKVKLKEYVRLHKIVTNLSVVDIWESLRKGESLDVFLQNVPDEFFDWVKLKKSELDFAYNEIENECKSAYKPIENRKEAAEYNKSQKYPMILFKILDEKKYDYIIWNLIKPKFEKAYNTITNINS